MTARRVAIRAPNWLGDAVMALPAMAAVREGLPDARLTIAAVPAVAPLFLEQTSASADGVLTIAEKESEAHQLAAGDFETIILLPNSFRTGWAARRARIADRWGYGTDLRGWTLTRSVRRPRARVHQAEWYLELVRQLGFSPGETVPRVSPTSHTRERARVILDEGLERHRQGRSNSARIDTAREVRLVGIAPGAAYGHAKRWPPKRVAELVVRLDRERGATAVLVGAPGDREAGREIESLLPDHTAVLNLIGRTDLRALVGVLAACSAFVSNDSGAMHLAAAVGVPVTAIFGPTDERVTAPLGAHDVLVHDVFCRPCMLRDCPIDHRCMTGISVDRVFASVTARLNGVAP
jgi:heptosyltransferase-2